MEIPKIKKNRLLMIAALLVAVMALFSLLVGNVAGKTFSYISTSLVYWCVFCIPLSVYFSAGAKG